MGLPVAYRDSRTNGLMARHNSNSANAIFINVAASSFCLQYDLSATCTDRAATRTYSTIAHALLIPDYFSYRLTGKMTGNIPTPRPRNWSISIATTGRVATGVERCQQSLVWSPDASGNVIGHWICPQGNEIPVVAVPAMIPPARLSPRR